jgi:hypothetical protein
MINTLQAVSPSASFQTEAVGVQSVCTWATTWFESRIRDNATPSWCVVSCVLLQKAWCDAASVAVEFTELAELVQNAYDASTTTRSSVRYDATRCLHPYVWLLAAQQLHVLFSDCAPDASPVSESAFVVMLGAVRVMPMRVVMGPGKPGLAPFAERVCQRLRLALDMDVVHSTRRAHRLAATPLRNFAFDQSAHAPAFASALAVIFAAHATVGWDAVGVRARPATDARLYTTHLPFLCVPTVARETEARVYCRGILDRDPVFATMALHRFHVRLVRNDRAVDTWNRRVCPAFDAHADAIECMPCGHSSTCECDGCVRAMVAVAGSRDTPPISALYARPLAPWTVFRVAVRAFKNHAVIPMGTRLFARALLDMAFALKDMSTDMSDVPVYWRAIAGRYTAVIRVFLSSQGVTGSYVGEICDVMASYFGGASRRAVASALSSIAVYDGKAVHTLVDLLNCVAEWCSVRTVPLPVSQAVAQRRALRTRWSARVAGLPADLSFLGRPPVASEIVYLCDTHPATHTIGRAMCRVPLPPHERDRHLHPRAPSIKPTVTARHEGTSESVMVDYHTDTTICQECVTTARLAPNAARHSMSREFMRMRALSMIGRLVRASGTWFTMCVGCGAVTTVCLRRSTFQNQGWLCPACSVTTLTRVATLERTELRLARSRKASARRKSAPRVKR